MRSSGTRAAVIWCVLAALIAGLQLVTVTSASPFAFSPDTRENEPVRLEGKAYAVAVAVAPVVNFPLRQIILGSSAPHTSLVDRVLSFLFLSGKDVATQHLTAARLDVTFTLLNTAVWLVFLALVWALVRWLSERLRSQTRRDEVRADATVR